MKNFFNETNAKITLVGIMLVGMIFLGSNRKELKDFNVNNLSILSLKENKNESKKKLFIKTNNFILKRFAKFIK